MLVFEGDHTADSALVAADCSRLRALAALPRQALDEALYPTCSRPAVILQSLCILPTIKHLPGSIMLKARFCNTGLTGAQHFLSSNACQTCVPLVFWLQNMHAWLRVHGNCFAH